jgi:hypothetical protein
MTTGRRIGSFYARQGAGQQSICGSFAAETRKVRTRYGNSCVADPWGESAEDVARESVVFAGIIGFFGKIYATSSRCSNNGDRHSIKKTNACDSELKQFCKKCFCSEMG